MISNQITNSYFQIELSLWGPCIESTGVIVNQKIIIKNLEVKNSKGKKHASIQYDSTIQVCQSDSEDDVPLK